MVSDVSSKLEVGPAVLGEWGEENIKLNLSETDDFDSGFFSKLLEVELSSGAEGFNGRCRSGQRQGVDNVGVWVNGGVFKSVQVDKDDTGISKQGGVLGGVDIVQGGTSRCKEREAGDDKLRAGGNGGQPGDDRRQCATGGVLKAGASGTWVIPSVVETVEDIVDDLKGGGRVLLVDGV